jgi:hypothetical protein
MSAIPTPDEGLAAQLDQLTRRRQAVRALPNTFGDDPAWRAAHEHLLHRRGLVGAIARAEAAQPVTQRRQAAGVERYNRKVQEAWAAQPVPVRDEAAFAASVSAKLRDIERPFEEFRQATAGHAETLRRPLDQLANGTQQLIAEEQVRALAAEARAQRAESETKRWRWITLVVAIASPVVAVTHLIG